MYYIPDDLIPSANILAPNTQNYQHCFTDTSNYINSRNLKTTLTKFQYYNPRRTIQNFAKAIEIATNTEINKLYAESVKIKNDLCQNQETLKSLLESHDICTTIIQTTEALKAVKINIIYVTSGYTFLKNYIQENDYPRYRRIENYIFTKTKDYVDNPAQYHCIVTKFYKPQELIENTNAEEFIVILTEVNYEIIDKLIYTLPLFVTNYEEYDEITPVTLDNENEENFIKTKDISTQDKLKQLLKTYLTNMFMAFPESTSEEDIQNFHTENFTEFVKRSWQIINYKDPAALQTAFITNLQEAYQRSILGDINNKLPDLESRINSTLYNLNNLYAEKERILKKISLQNALENDAIKNIFETLDYFKQIEIQNISSGTITISIIGPLINYDYDALKIFLENPTSSHNQSIRNRIINNYSGCDLSEKLISNAQKIIHEIFVEHKYTIITQQIFDIHIARESSPTDILDIEPVRTIEPYKYMPNPHIYGHSCYGNAMRIMVEAMHTQDFETMFGQLIYASQQLTAEDTIVFSTLINQLVRFQHKTIKEEATNELYTFNELLNKMEQNKE